MISYTVRCYGVGISTLLGGSHELHMRALLLSGYLPGHSQSYWPVKVPSKEQKFTPTKYKSKACLASTDRPGVVDVSVVWPTNSDQPVRRRGGNPCHQLFIAFFFQLINLAAPIRYSGSECREA